MTPPDTGFAFQLVCRILRLQFFSYPQQAEFLLKSVQPLISFQRFNGLLEKRRLCVLEILEVAVLICLSALAGMATTPVLLRHSLHSFIEHPLTLNKSC